MRGCHKAEVIRRTWRVAANAANQTSHRECTKVNKSSGIKKIRRTITLFKYKNKE